LVGGTQNAVTSSTASSVASARVEHGPRLPVEAHDEALLGAGEERAAGGLKGSTLRFGMKRMGIRRPEETQPAAGRR
jgi:hypothetical protein